MIGLRIARRVPAEHHPAGRDPFHELVAQGELVGVLGIGRQLETEQTAGHGHVADVMGELPEPLVRTDGQTRDVPRIASVHELFERPLIHAPGRAVAESSDQALDATETGALEERLEFRPGHEQIAVGGQHGSGVDRGRNCRIGEHVAARDFPGRCEQVRQVVHRRERQSIPAAQVIAPAVVVFVQAQEQTRLRPVQQPLERADEQMFPGA